MYTIHFQVKIEGVSKKRKYGDAASSVNTTIGETSTVQRASESTTTVATSSDNNCNIKYGGDTASSDNITTGETSTDKTTTVQTVSGDQLKSVEETIVWCEYVTEMLDSKRCQVSSW